MAAHYDMEETSENLQAMGLCVRLLGCMMRPCKNAYCQRFAHCAPGSPLHPLFSHGLALEILLILVRKTARIAGMIGCIICSQSACLFCCAFLESLWTYLVSLVITSDGA